MMEDKGGQLHCRPCAARLVEEAAAAARRGKGYNTHVSVDAIYRWSLVLSLLAAVVWLGPRLLLWNAVQRGAPAVDVAQPWASKPHAQWPEMVLAVESTPGAALVRDGVIPPHYGPNGFFVNRKGGGLAFATVVAQGDGASGGIEPVVPAFAQWSREFGGCIVRPFKGQPLALKSLLPSSEKTFPFGTILLQCEGKPPEGCIALNPRGSIFTAGMRMFVAGRDPASKKQIVLKATVASANLESDLNALLDDRPYSLGALASSTSGSLVELEVPVVEDQVVGAPLIDTRGNLVAVITDPIGEKDLDGRTTDYLALGVAAITESLGGLGK
jgi:hypothetical protein